MQQGHLLRKNNLIPTLSNGAMKLEFIGMIIALYNDVSYRWNVIVKFERKEQEK